ncbi:glycosyltransferase family 4 protein [Anaerosalibacter massiliensis]|uniref:Glycosyltransferase family 4 protein n=1 Tax=Anaerosalibacter massiliensis TaxID=1347392 RepID=A0A9X2MKT4_9FIRM|nr:glycosyltransferase family 4 protein [Anaerosalibacter massiliensis]MCR2045353.1 glycosyltransferase family 4 protein [Anaerosalibacter massiliensis]
MKIVHLCLCGPYNDDWGYQENIIPKYNKKDGYDVAVITSVFINSTKDEGYEQVSPGEYFLEDGIKVIRIPFENFFITKIAEKLRVYENLYEKLKQEKPDLIFIHGIQFLSICDVIRYKRVYPEVKIFADNHADYVNSARNFISKYILHKVIWKSGIKSLVPECEKIFGVTPNRCDFLIEMYNIPKQKVELLVMGADSERIDFDNKDKIRKTIRKDLCLEDDDFVLITGGKIDEGKNIHRLIEAINEIADNKLKLIVFGIPSEDMRDIIDNLSISPHIRNIGWISSNDVYNYFLASDLAVFPGTHSVLWEQAVGTGLPCIFKKWEGMSHVDVGGNCKFIGEGNVKEIKTVINGIYNDTEKYCKMKEIALKKGVSYFSYRKISRRAIGNKSIES